MRLFRTSGRVILCVSCLGVAAAAQDLTAVFSDDATEGTVGVFLAVNPLTDRDPRAPVFPAARLGMRPFQVSAAGASSVTLSVIPILGDPELLEVHDEAGARLSLPATWSANDLPAQILVNARSTGEALLRLQGDAATVSGSAGVDDVLVRVGPFPGLAGHELGQYPFFEFPKAVREDRDLKTALDPIRHQERLGLAYDIYVVRHKSPTEWANDDTLLDVTSTIETATVTGTTIQQNVSTPWTAPLDSNAGAGFGKPYDVVFDFGQDGRLDPGDLIDGFSHEEAGFYAVKDTTAPGPHATSSFEFDDPDLFFVEGFDGGSTRRLRSRGLVVYPDPLPPGKLPLVTFSHGNTAVGDSYKGYEYLQRMLASHGFITASFDMFPAHVSLGIRWRGWLTNLNTERLILQTNKLDDMGNPYPPMGGGAIDDRVDPDRIVTSGHSRGGEGVILQYNQVAHPGIPGIRPPNGVLEGFDEDSFLGIHTIAQVTFLTEAEGSKPDDVPYLLFYGSSDSDVCGCGSGALPTIHYNRAYGEKAMSYLYGAGHGYYNTRWSCFCVGPFTMTRSEVEAASLGYLFPWVMRVVRGNVPATDFFTRQPDVFRPIGTDFIPAEKIMVNLYREAAAEGNFVIDDYEMNPDEFVSSSGYPADHDLNKFFEGFLLDTDPSGGFKTDEWNGGFWWETSGAIGTYRTGDFYYNWDVDPAEADFSDDTDLSFITCQQPGHQHTEDVREPRAFDVVLIDTHGVESSISTTSYGGIQTEYNRDDGWGAAFGTWRIRLADFETNGSGIDLRDIQRVEFRFGSNYDLYEKGRLGFDDLEVIKD